MREDFIRQIIKDRPRSEKVRRNVKRFFTMSFSVFILILGWAAIIYFSIKETEIASYLREKVHSLAGSWGPTALITIINYIVPWVLSKITELEEWDFSATFIKHEVWRTYLAAILNNIIYAVIQAEILLNKPLL